jgi:hypothetical protein
MRRTFRLTISLSLVSACAPAVSGVKTDPAVKAQRIPTGEFDDKIDDHSKEMREQGREIFRYDTFGSEAFWGDKLALHRAIADQEHGGLGKGLTPREALKAGLKVDVGKLPEILVQAIKGGKVDLDKAGTTIELLKANSVVGVKGFFNGNTMTGIGITCALCHSTVDDSLTAGIGRRLDGWPNRDLNVGAIAAMAPTLAPMASLLNVPEDKVRTVLVSWGPGRYDAELNQDGKAFRPDCKTAATLIPAAFGLAGVNLHTYTGWGSVTYWNAYVANTQMYGQGTFFDPRLKDHKYPVAGRGCHGAESFDLANAPCSSGVLQLVDARDPQRLVQQAGAPRGHARDLRQLQQRRRRSRSQAVEHVRPPSPREIANGRRERAADSLHLGQGPLPEVPLEIRVRESFDRVGARGVRPGPKRVVTAEAQPAGDLT